MLLHGIIVKGKQNNSTLSNLTSTLSTYRQSEGRSVAHSAGFRTAANNNRELAVGYCGRWEVSRGFCEPIGEQRLVDWEGLVGQCSWGGTVRDWRNCNRVIV